MRLIVGVAVRFVVLVVGALLLVLAVEGHSQGQAAPAQPAIRCDAKRDQCRAACFDKFASRDEAAFGKCKEGCNQEWLACSGKR